MQVLRTGWDKKSRINADADLDFGSDLGNYARPGLPDSRYDFGTTGFSFCFFIDRYYIARDSYIFQVFGPSYGLIVQINESSIIWTYNNIFIDNTNISTPIPKDSKIMVYCGFNGQDYVIKFNGIDQATKPSTDPFNSDWNLGSTTNYVFGNRINLSVSATAHISHYCWFNRALTDKEISYISINGGILPESAHEFCVAHYPLQTAYFDGVNNVTPDVVEQYNYAKVTPLVANHGVLVNFTDDELGIVNPSSQTAVKDFYDKWPLADRGLYVDGLSDTSKTGKPYIIGNDVVADLTGNYYSFFNELIFPESAAIVASSRMFATTNAPDVGSLVGSAYIIFRFTTTTLINVLVQANQANVVNGGIQILLSQIDGGIFGKKIRIGGSIDFGNGTGVLQMNIGNQVFKHSYTGAPTYSISNNVGITIGQTPFFGNVTNQINVEAFISNDLVDASQVEYIVSHRDFSGLDIVQHYRPRQADVSNMPDLSSYDNDGVLENLSAALILEAESLMPPRQKALTFNGTSQYLRVPNFNPTGELGYTQFYVYQLPDVANATNYILSKKIGAYEVGEDLLGNGISYRHHLRNASLVAEIVRGMKADNINMSGSYWKASEDIQIGYEFSSNKITPIAQPTVVTNNYNDSADDLLIGASGQYVGQYRFKGLIMYMAIFKGEVSEKEMKILRNNGLLKNPSIQLQNKYSLELFIDFNNPFDDAGTLKFPDLSPNAHDVIAEGYTDLATLQSNLVDIDSLR